MSVLLDPGAQNERTSLSWQRTVLALLVCSLVVARLLVVHAPLAGTLVAGGTGTLAVVIAGRARRRYHRARAALQVGGSLRAGNVLPDGRDALALTLLLVVAGIGAVLLLLTW